MIPIPEPAEYFRTVWEIVRQVPTGQVTTFKQIAEMIPPPAGIDEDDYVKVGPRWVGDALNAVSIPDEPTVPWHRVINSRGSISLPELSEGAALQRGRLIAEGVEFDAKERVDFGRYGWEGPENAWVEANGLRPARSLRKNADQGPQQLSLF